MRNLCRKVSKEDNHLIQKGTVKCLVTVSNTIYRKEVSDYENKGNTFVQEGASAVDGDSTMHFPPAGNGDDCGGEDSSA